MDEVLVATMALSFNRAGQVLEDFLLDGFVFGGRLDHQFAVPQVFHGAGGADACQRRRNRIFADRALGRLALHVLFDPVQRLAQRLLVQIVQHHIISGQREDVGDPRAHLSRADNANAF